MKRLLFLLLIPLNAFALDTPVFDTAAMFEGAGFGATPQMFNIAIAANTNRALFLFCHGYASTSNSAMTDATYNGVSMTLITNIGASDGDNSRLYAWKLVAPPAGTNTITVTWDGNMDGFMKCFAESWYNIEQSTTTRSATSRTSGAGTEESSSLSATSVSGDIVLDVIGWRFSGQGTITIGAGQTQRFQSTLVANTMGSSEPAVGVSTTMSWSWATLGWTPDSHIAFAVIPSTTAGTGGVPPPLFSRHRRRE